MILDETPDRLGSLTEPMATALADLRSGESVARLWAADHTLWRPDETEVSDRLGWLTVMPEMMIELEALRAQCLTLSEGTDHVVIMGMGGSSLFPHVVADSFTSGAGYPALHVLDTTDPAAVARVGELPPERTLYIASSKSGTTLETTSQLEWAWRRHPDPSRFAVITDPGSELEALAVQRGFAAVWRNRADIGGRYSALSHFGIVPALFAGADVEGLLTSASTMAERLRGAPSVNPGARLAAVLAAGVRTGRDKLTLVLPESIATFGLWVEQLVAESTGKDGTGVVPVVGEPLGAPDDYGNDRLFVALTDGDEGDDVDGDVARAEVAQLDGVAAAGHPVWVLPVHGPSDLGAQVMLWEVATALCGALLDIHPFDQPDVAATKEETARVLSAVSATSSASEGGNGAGSVASDDATDLEGLFATLQPGDYLAIQAFMDPESADVARLEQVRVALRDRFQVATTLGLGPRYLHSTGQLHKGGPASGVFIQVVSDPGSASVPAVEVPGQGYDFGGLLVAQADGDLAALRERGRRVVRVPLDVLLAAG